MKKFQFKSANPGPDYLEGTVEAESSEMAIKAIKEEHKSDSGTYILMSADETISFSIPHRSQEPIERTESRDFNSFGRKVRWLGTAIFPLPVILTIVGMFCFSSPEHLGRHGWVFFVVVIPETLGFAIAKVIIVEKMLESFVCPRCHTPNDDWQRDSKFRIYYHCPQCRIRWNVGYKLDPRKSLAR